MLARHYQQRRAEPTLEIASVHLDGQQPEVTMRISVLVMIGWPRSGATGTSTATSRNSHNNCSGTGGKPWLPGHVEGSRDVSDSEACEGLWLWKFLLRDWTGLSAASQPS